MTELFVKSFLYNIEKEAADVSLLAKILFGAGAAGVGYAYGKKVGRQNKKPSVGKTIARGAAGVLTFPYGLLGYFYGKRKGRELNRKKRNK